MAKSLVEPGSYPLALDLMKAAGGKLHLPTDAVAAAELSSDAESKFVDIASVPEGWQVLDIGPETLATYSEIVHNARTVFWNGPLGVFELPPFAVGTFGLAKAIASSQALSIVGGGDSAAAVHQAGLTESVTHVSTGGGAALALLEGKPLPGLSVLRT